MCIRRVSFTVALNLSNVVRVMADTGLQHSTNSVGEEIAILFYGASAIVDQKELIAGLVLEKCSVLNGKRRL